MPEASPTAEGASAVAAPGALRASHEDRDKAVDVLRIAAGDGRLTAAELDERLEAALSARTVGELAELTADLPSGTGAGLPGAAPLAAKDTVRIDQEGSAVERTGRWVVPRRLELHTSYSAVTLDFTQAVLVQDTVQIDMDISGGSVVLVTGPGTVVDADSLAVTYGVVKIKRTPPDGAPVTLRVELTGKILYSQVVVRAPRRTFWQWLLRRAPEPYGRRA